MRDIEQRKRDHLKLAQDESLKFNISAGFDRWRLIHNALPEIDLKAVDTSTTFLGKRLNFPLLISSMSGGAQESLELNKTLGIAAETVGCALGLGSIRAALEDDALANSFLIAREVAPHALLLANLGVAQVMEGSYLQKAINFCDELKADGLIIHLNPLQEAFQPDGDTQFKGALDAIQTWVKNFPLPIIIKEVGQGLSPEVIQRLEGIGVETVDIAGAGGSNWISIEKERLSAEQTVLKQSAEAFADWGEPTAEVLAELNTDLTLISSGGLTSPLDLVKSIALGAHLGGVAGAILKPAMTGDQSRTIELLHVWQKTLSLAMFGVGVSSIAELRGNRSLIKRID